MSLEGEIKMRIRGNCRCTRLDVLFHLRYNKTVYLV